MPEYDFLVSWEMPIHAKNALEAARKALEIQRDPESIALVFDVTECITQRTEQIDLLEVEE